MFGNDGMVKQLDNLLYYTSSACTQPHSSALQLAVYIGSTTASKPQSTTPAVWYICPHLLR